jgi:uncharacterized membrane protein YqjE
VREEIALAKAELTDKVTKLVKGAVVGAVAGIFALLGLLYLLNALSWLAWRVVDGPGGAEFWIGFLIVAVLLFLLGAIGAFLALRFVKKGSPPTPKMAIEEAQLIRQTISQSSAAPASSAASSAGLAATPGSRAAAEVDR